MFYASQIEVDGQPLLLSTIQEFIHDRPVELTRGHRTARTSFDQVVTGYAELVPENAESIREWGKQVHDLHPGQLDVNAYIVHVGPKRDTGLDIKVREYDGGKYGLGFFAGSDTKPTDAKQGLREVLFQ